MAYKLIASDIDGTLLKDNGEMSPAVRSAIFKAVERGVIFTLATGRPIQGVEAFLSLVSGDAPVITCNGAIIVTAKTRKILSREELPYLKAKELLSVGLAEGATVVAWADSKLYASEPCGYSRLYATLTQDTAMELSQLPKSAVTKILWILPTHKLLSLQGSFLPPEGVQCKASGEHYLEFFSAHAGKGAGLERLAQLLGISRCETMALGDNFNDIEMLAWAGLGVAMDNAPQQVKESANYIAQSNQEDGAARAIEKFILCD